MNWKQPTAPRLQPPSGTYSEWKTQIAIACHNQCVYCAISESSYGGLDNFHVEHYKPKSRFVSLTNVIENLFLSCAICNRFKGDDWPNEPLPDHSRAGYPDPSLCDYNLLFEVDNDMFTLAGHHVASKYLVERLYLNRPQLIKERRLMSYLARLNKLCDELIQLVQGSAVRSGNREILQRAVDLLSAAVGTQQIAFQARAAIPYQLPEVRRPAS